MVIFWLKSKPHLTEAAYRISDPHGTIIQETLVDIQSVHEKKKIV